MKKYVQAIWFSITMVIKIKAFSYVRVLLLLTYTTLLIYLFLISASDDDCSETLKV